MKHETVDFVCQSEIFPIIQSPTTPPATDIPSETSEVFTPSQPTISVFLTSPLKVSHLEGGISFIKKLNDNEYLVQANLCIIEKLKRDLLNNKKDASSYILESYCSHVDGDAFFKWLAKSLLYRPNRLLSVLDKNKASSRNSRIPESMYQGFTIFG